MKERCRNEQRIEALSVLWGKSGAYEPYDTNKNVLLLELQGVRRGGKFRQ